LTAHNPGRIQRIQVDYHAWYERFPSMNVAVVERVDCTVWLSGWGPGSVWR
jgi:hypothetical protein